jgi:two-component system, sensor histidine kinase
MIAQPGLVVLWVTTALAFLAAIGFLVRRQRRNLAEIRKLKSEIQQLQKVHELRIEEDKKHRLNTEREVQAAIEASAQKSHFLAAASHDLRQPIHAITLFVAALAAEQLVGRNRYLVDRLHRSLAGLDELFNRLLDISRLDTGAIEARMAVFPITSLLQNLDARFAQLASNKNIEFRVRLGATANVNSDPSLLIEIVMNLLSNAFRYTERGGVLLATRRRGKSLLIQIWDTGPGIAKENLELIFKEFVQLDNPSRDRRKGLGLGLAIVRRLSEALNHQVSVYSRPGRGSLFEIAVPISNELPLLKESTADEAPQTDLTGLLILVVDDEIEVLLAMEALLSAWGCFALLARSIPEALSRLSACERFPDALLTDHAVADGVSSAEIIAAVRAVVPIEMRVAVVSGEASSALEKSITASGWTFMSKPINPAKLREFLGKA